MLNVGCISIGYSNFRYDIAEQNLLATLQYLEAQDINLVAHHHVIISEQDIIQTLDNFSSKNLDLLILELGTYSYGSVLMSFLEKMKGVQLLLWAFREPIIEGYSGLPLNSLCALNMYTSFLKKMNRTDFFYIYGTADEPDALSKLQSILQATTIHKRLHQARFCIVGGRVPGFYLSNVDELKFRSEIGPEIIYYSLASLIEDAKGIAQQAVDEDMINSKALVNSCNIPIQIQQKCSRIYLALKRFAQSNNIDGFAIKCWPDFQELENVAVCAVVARLNQEGMVTSCEGDVTGLTTMFIQSNLSDFPVFLTDLVNITTAGVVKLWHCGSAAPALAANPQCTSYCAHPTMMHIEGAAVQLDLKPGKVMLCKLTEGIPYKLLAIEGECIPPDRVLTGNQGDIRFKFDSKKLLDLIVSEGIEHHYSLAYECDFNVIVALCKQMGIRLLTL